MVQRKTLQLQVQFVQLLLLLWLKKKLHFNIASPSVCPKKYIKYICFSTDCCFLMNNSNYLYSKLDFEIFPFNVNVNLSFGIIVAQVAVFISLHGYNFSESSWRHTLTAKTLLLCWLQTFCLLLIYNNESWVQELRFRSTPWRQAQQTYFFSPFCDCLSWPLHLLQRDIFFDEWWYLYLFFEYEINI